MLLSNGIQGEDSVLSNINWTEDVFSVEEPCELSTQLWVAQRGLWRCFQIEKILLKTCTMCMLNVYT